MVLLLIIVITIKNKHKMMKNLILALLLILTNNLFAQKSDDNQPIKKHELKFDVFNTIAFKAPAISYEYLLNEESSIGISGLINLYEDDNDGEHFIDLTPEYNEKYMITPYYRRFFSRKPAWGFFIEGFGMINKQEKTITQSFIDSNSNVTYKKTLETSNNFAMGIAVGGKFVTNKGFTFEFFGGLGRNIATSNSKIATEVVPRLGILVGYRL